MDAVNDASQELDDARHVVEQKETLLSTAIHECIRKTRRALEMSTGPVDVSTNDVQRMIQLTTNDETRADLELLGDTLLNREDRLRRTVTYNTPVKSASKR